MERLGEKIISGAYSHAIDAIVRREKERRRLRTEEDFEPTTEQGRRYFSLKLPRQDEPKFRAIKSDLLWRANENLSNVDVMATIVSIAYEVIMSAREEEDRRWKEELPG